MYYLASYSRVLKVGKQSLRELLNSRTPYLSEILSSQQQIVDVRVLKISLEGTVGCRGHGSNHSQALSTCRRQITIINRINPVLWIRIQHFK
jgi:hypothetical protein